jgi:cytidylate kinase
VPRAHQGLSHATLDHHIMDAVTPHVVAIDGPAASGESSVAYELARKLGFVYVNSGAMYRAITWHVLDRGIDPSDTDGVARLIENTQIDCDLTNNESRVFVEGVDVENHLRDVRVNQGVSLVSSVPRVREILVAKMRGYAADQDVVMEGRDIGSVVFPNTPYKFYIDATHEIRSRRRAAQGQSDQIAARDRADSSRRDSPLTIASDATVIDSSDLSIEEVVDRVIEHLRSIGFALDSTQTKPVAS